MDISSRPPGHLSPRLVSSSMKNKMFRGSLQQDAQEFLRCLLTQVHDEIGIQVPSSAGFMASQKSCDSANSCQRDSMTSCVSHDSACSSSSGDSSSKLVVSTRNSPQQARKKSTSLSRQKPGSSIPSSPANPPKFSLRGSYTKIWGGSSSRGSTESLEMRKHSSSQQHTHTALTATDVLPQREGEEEVEEKETRLKWSEGDVFVVDMITRQVTVHSTASSQASATIKQDENQSVTKPGRCNGEEERSKDSVASLPVGPTEKENVPPSEPQGEGKKWTDESCPNLGRLSPEEDTRLKHSQPTVKLRERKKMSKYRYT